ncbi:RNA dependent RNA polymerase-domain-containing protein [Xylariomycetidae sp. FL0641]|nr:RNA dependent RNA polymerase-domain-containing protein [Xylariomycetidae sp. FL0641]
MVPRKTSSVLHGSGLESATSLDSAPASVAAPASLTAPDSRSGLTSTPSKTRYKAGSFDVWFLEFSNQYNLNLRRPDPTMTPRQKKKMPDYHELVFYDRLQAHYWRGNADKIEKHFDRGARKIHSKWVNKPSGEPDATPARSSLPRATTEPERRQLINLLGDTLEALRPTTVADALRSSTQPQVSATDLPSEPTSPSLGRRSKRLSDESASFKSAKRSRGSPEESRPASPLSNIDRMETRTTTPMPRLASSRQTRNSSLGSKRDFYSLSRSGNTSKSSIVSKVFSEGDDQGPLPASQETQGTQVTVEASTQEKLRRPPALSDIDSLAPSSGTERALEASFNEYNAIQKRDKAKPKIPSSSANSYSDFSLPADLMTEYDALPIPSSSPPQVRRPTPATDKRPIESSLLDVWPKLPPHLDRAPLAVRWEILRVALHCEVEPTELRLQYDPALDDYARLWQRLRALPIFEGKSFPEKSRSEAWSAGMSPGFRSTDQIVLLTATLSANLSKQTGSPLRLRLEPLRLDLPHRLARRFGSDRFLELVIPSLSSQELRHFGDEALDKIRQWLVRDSHVLLGRDWTAFYVKPSLPKKVTKDDTLKPETMTIPQERIYMFAENGDEFSRTEGTSPQGETVNAHTIMTRGCLLEWLLQISRSEKNQKQSIFKLFSRVALGLSRTRATVVLQPDQIRHQVDDIRSPTGQVMNDGIARMSPALARQIRDHLGLADVPAGYQGRFGSAKGFWIRDTTETSDAIWIETMPSQRKWECDYEEEDQRTFEVHNEARELKSAGLNLQLLPILQDRAIDTEQMKRQVGDFLGASLHQEIDAQKKALEDPLQFMNWVQENSSSSRKQDRIRTGHIARTGGLPTSREDQMELLLRSGFDPMKLEFLGKIAYSLRKERCEELQSRLNVKVGRSTYAYMVVDFLGILEEDEVHLGFSGKFSDEQSGFSETCLHGMDVLVARVPAHYPSDIQRVKAVFKPELHSLKDVIVFPTKGNIPLADKLSGGDYDGDIAWVCWEPSIVNNFENSPVPEAPDLFGQGILSKKGQTYKEISDSSDTKDITTDFLDQAFQFNLQPSLLGQCTNYKEKLCYSRGSVRDDTAVFLSTLISNLVDRTKQGIVFTNEDWARLRKELNSRQGDPQRKKHRLEPPAPQYKGSDWTGNSSPTHIIDYVKFQVGKPIVEVELRALDHFLGSAKPFDEDLVKFFKHYEKFRRPPAERRKAEQEGKFKKNTWETILDELKKDIDAVAMDWANSRLDFSAKVSNTYDKWQEITPTGKVISKQTQGLMESSFMSVGLSAWDLLKASYLFKMYYAKYPSLPWYVAGAQLAFLKATACSRGTEAPPVLVAPRMYAGLKADASFARGVAALNEGLTRPAAAEDADEGSADEDV